MTATGVGAAIVRLRNIAEKVPAGSRQQMHRSAERIVKEAKILVPVDVKALEDSIRIEKTYGERGRLQIDIVAGGQMAVGKNGLVNLDQYASLVHEAYETAVAYVNGAGPETRKKMAAHPDKVIGSKFLERAAEAEEPVLQRNIIAVIMEAGQD